MADLIMTNFLKQSQMFLFKKLKISVRENNGFHRCDI